jgi:hypothetical protein
MQGHAAESNVWPPDYVQLFAERIAALNDIRTNPIARVGAKEYYRTRPIEFIEDWCDTYDPRNAGSDKPARMPFKLFRRQRDLIAFLLACLNGDASGLIEKCRDVGATWVCCAFSVWLWLFWPGVAVGWGSRKEQLVDKLGDPDSIFEKMRMIVNGLPQEFLPAGFSPNDHMTYMKFINPETGATITGEAGDNIGRGGRKRIYFKDESAHYERPEKIEAALADNTRVQIDISSVNGIGNVFHRRRESGIEWEPGQEVSTRNVNVFVIDWRHHPAKDETWYEDRKAKATSEGLLHVFAQEVDRNYAASVEGIIIKPEWVRACVDADEKLGFDDAGRWSAALDVADEGGDLNALTKRKGVILKYARDWGEGDTGQTARTAIGECSGLGTIYLQYDSVGVGAGVKAESNRLKAEGNMPKGLRLVPWNAGAGVLDPDEHLIKGDRNSPTNKDFFGNFKAQAWWNLALRCERTYRAVTEGIKYDPSDLISFSSKDLGTPMVLKIEKELCQATRDKNSRMQIIINKKPEGTRSPNIAESIVMNYFPAPAGPLPYEDWV